MSDQPDPLVVKRSTKFSDNFFKELHGLQEANRLVDFTIKVKDQSISCHQVVLAAACPYFAALLNSGMSETEKNEVSLDNLDFEVVKLIVSYFYTGEISIPWKIMKCMIEALEFLQLNELKSEAKEYIPVHIVPENCIGWFKFAEQFGMEEIAALSKTMMHTEFEAVSKHNEFLMLQLEEVIDYIQDDNIDLPNLDCILKACLKWVVQDEDHEKHIGDLISHVDLKKCTFVCLEFVTSTYSDLIERSEREVERMLLKASVQTGSSELSRLTSVKEDEPNLVIIGGRVKTQSSECLKLNQSCDWETLLNIPTEFLYKNQAICETADGFALLGGSGVDSVVTGSSCVYSRGANKWETIPPMPTARRWATCLCIKHCIYCIGGTDDDNKAVSAVEIYDECTKVWEATATIPANPWLPLAVSTSPAYIHVISRGPNPQVTLYSIKPKTWGLSVPFPESVPSANGCSAMSHGNCVYIFGGKLADGLQYDTMMRTWTVLASPTLSHSWGSAVYFRRKIWLLGGECDDIELYDIEEDKWEVSPIKLPKKLKHHKAVLWKV